jgi:hypothetical protein
MDFAAGTVVDGIVSSIPAGCVPLELVGHYIQSYYVQELRITFDADDVSDRVYGRHSPIFENICGFIALGFPMEPCVPEIICVHGNIVFKRCNAIFKGVRDVDKIIATTRGVLGGPFRDQHLCALVNMAVVTACLGKSSIVGTTGSLLETSLFYTQGAACIGLVAKTESEKNMVKIKILDWSLLLEQSVAHGYSTTSSSFSSPDTLESNYCIVSNNGFIIIRFHWNNIEWTPLLEKDVMLACSLLTQCIWHNC